MCVAGLCLALNLLLAYLTYGQLRVGESLHAKPWRDVAAKTGDPTMRSCPFSEREVTHRCRSCGVQVADLGWHAADRNLRFQGADVPLQWSLITIALSKVSNPREGRRECDAAMSLRGNLLNGDLSESCVGCYSSMLCSNVMPRLSWTAHAASFLCALGPFSVPEAIKTLHPSVIKALLGLLATGAILFAVLGLALTVLSSGMAATFLSAMPHIDWLRAMPERGPVARILDACYLFLPVQYQAKAQAMPEESIRALNRAHTNARSIPSLHGSRQGAQSPRLYASMARSSHRSGVSCASERPHRKPVNTIDTPASSGRRMIA